MIGNFIQSIFGSKNERELRRMAPVVDAINRLEPSYQAYADAELMAKTSEFKERLSRGETLDAILPEAFAAVREASVRVLGMRHFDVQLIGGIVLHKGQIAEMKTGEGKTLAATLPLYLNALTGRGAHLVTVNDYLASEKVPPDSELYEILMTIQKHGTNAKRIVENLLSFVRYKEHGEEDVDINKIIEEVITIKGHAMSISNISVKKNMAESLPIIKGNAGELQQVFFNIVNNAISAMKSGGNLIIQTGVAEAYGTQNVEVRISDTGIGIKPEHRSRIYDPLFTTKKVGEGTGLGLTVSYAIIKKYGGEVTFETRIKEESAMSGTTFTLVLPAGKGI